VAQNQLPDPQEHDGQGRRQALRAKEALNRAEEVRRQAAGGWVYSPRQAGKSAAAELILPPGVRRDAGAAAFLERYHTDPEFHAKIYEAVEASLAEERDKVILDAQGKPFLIETEDGLPANTAANMLEEIRKIRTWEQIEAEAKAEEEAKQAEEASRICIWCGKVCESVEALEVHEDECA
jgi:hypothetical protein